MPTRVGNREPGFKSRRGKDQKITYTTDIGTDITISVRTFIDSSNNPIPTKPPLWNARIDTSGNPCAAKLKGMRNIELCIPNANNKQGFSLFNLPNPYNDNRLLELLKEFSNQPDVQRIRYTGESIGHDFVL